MSSRKTEFRFYKLRSNNSGAMRQNPIPKNPAFVFCILSSKFRIFLDPFLLLDPYA